jgi:adenosylcobinamide-GDP ribazoletransferase
VYSFLVALQFLTRLPAVLRRDTTPEDLGRSIGWFPVVGVVLGITLATADRMAGAVFHPAVANALLVALLAAITGALHLDGLIDTAEGLVVGPDRAARLDAMRQTVVGPTGVLAATLVLLGTFGALGALDPSSRGSALFLAPVCGRASILAAYGLYPYARAEGTLSSFLKAGATPRRMAAGLSLAAIACMLVAGLGGFALLVLGLGVMHVIARVALARVAGLTGDVHGAICETTQLAVLLAAPLALRF